MPFPACNTSGGRQRSFAESVPPRAPAVRRITNVALASSPGATPAAGRGSRSLPVIYLFACSHQCGPAGSDGVRTACFLRILLVLSTSGIT